MVSGLSDIPFLIVEVLALVVGLVIHESAHALVAYALGDQTAKQQGRISLNPLNHIDPFGTVVLPALMLLAGGPVFAFAKPVPVYLGNLKNPKRDEVLVSLAGPLSNLILALIAASDVYMMLSTTMFGDVTGNAALSMVVYFFIYSISINLSLCFFNLIPLPPLDGSSIIVPFLKGRALQKYYEIQRYAMPILIVVLYLLPMVAGIDLIEIYFNFTVYPLTDALLSAALAF